MAAPAISNYKQLKNLSKPEYEKMQRLNAKYRPQFVDETAGQNIVRNQFNSTSDNIKNATAGSQAAMRSNLLGAQLNMQKGLSEARQSAEAQNRQQRIAADQFNANVDQFNISQDAREKDINARNMAAYRKAKSQLKANAAENIAGVGKFMRDESTLRKIYGYDSKGNKISEKEAAKKAAKETEAAANAGLTDSKYVGGIKGNPELTLTEPGQNT